LNGHSPEEIPNDIFDNPKSMLDFQVKGIVEHIQKVDDDYIPYLMPWYGVGVIPHLFGCDIKFFKTDDPACSSHGVKELKEIRKLMIPDFKSNELSKKVLDTIRFFRESSSIPVGITDMQSTLDCAALIVGYENLFYWMNDNPEDINYLFEVITDTLIEWVKIQKQYNGEKMDFANGLINVKTPDGIGIWFSDDDAVILSPGLYKKFVVEKYRKLFGAFGGGMIHWCGNANHQIENFLNIKPIRAVHDYILGNVDSVVPLQKELKRKKVCLVIGDIIPVEDELEDYLRQIKDKLNPQGLVLQFTISPKLGLKNGKYTVTERDVMKSAQRILRFFRG
jgi:uroporphyrinogen-III decarboxylase